MRASNFVIMVSLALSIGVSYASDIAFYTGNPGGPTGMWYAKADMLQDVEKITNAVKVMFKEVKSFDDEQLEDFQAWAEANLNDGELDIIWLPGSMPSVLYPVGNVQPDGSIAEEWLDNGNMFITLGDWFAHNTCETGVLQKNTETGAENILDLPGVIASTDNLAVKITATGKKYLPSAEDFLSDRTIQLNVVTAPWEVAALFGSPSGTEDDTQGDPVVIHNTETKGYIAFITQTRVVKAPDMDRATVTIELIENWVLKIIMFPVESQDKLTTTWAGIKAQN